ncbi:hypothetical protein LCGC14_1476020 [marine sediment metagenome]|uniref:Uncharacterized protein n=1 Tax=marine sediment metagenome TaxID=412755 RepID=A0A0F9MCN7_9ZZZZ
MIKIGDWIRTDLGLSGRVIGTGVLTTREWPAWKIETRDGKITAVLKEDTELWVKGD